MNYAQATAGYGRYCTNVHMTSVGRNCYLRHQVGVGEVGHFCFGGKGMSATIAEQPQTPRSEKERFFCVLFFRTTALFFRVVLLYTSKAQNVRAVSRQPLAVSSIPAYFPVVYTGTALAGPLSRKNLESQTSLTSSCRGQGSSNNACFLVLLRVRYTAAGGLNLVVGCAFHRSCSLCWNACERGFRGMLMFQTKTTAKSSLGMLSVPTI